MPLLLEHRTHYGKNFASEYMQELLQTYQHFSQYLPNKAKLHVLDIGCGMCGIDVFISQNYPKKTEFVLLDKNGTSKKINCGFHKDVKDFSFYSDFSQAAALLESNGVDDYQFVDISKHEFPKKSFDVVISLLSWGFHYPISTYNPAIKKGGIIIADIRKGTDGEKQLSNFGELKIIHEAKKLKRVLVKCR